MKSVSEASANTTAASTSPAGVFPSRATTSAGTSIIRSTVSTFGRFRGNTTEDIMMSAMNRRTLGPDGPEVSEIGLGCMGMSAFYGTADEGEARATIERALDLGCNFLDTSDMYGPHTNERLAWRPAPGAPGHAFGAAE